MNSFRPTAPQERWLSMASGVFDDQVRRWIAERTDGWIAVKSITRCALFVLGLFVAGLTATVFIALHMPGYLLVTGLILVAAAEWLVLQRHFFGGGIEEALEVAGLAMIAFQFVGLSQNALGTRDALLMAAVFAIAGLRFLNPLFVALSAVMFSCVIGFAGTQHPDAHRVAQPIAAAFCFSLACAALMLGAFVYRRPSYDRMLDWLVMSMPVAGYAWLAMRLAAEVGPVRHAAALVLGLFGVAALIVGIRRHAHAPIMAFMICLVPLGYELRHLTDLSVQANLILWGSAALLLTLGLNRYLRVPRRGIMSSKVGEDDEAFDLLQLAGAGVLGAQSAYRPAAQFKGGDGKFGGGGADGSF